MNIMTNHYVFSADLPISQQKPLVKAIRLLLAGGLVLGVAAVKANPLPVPTVGSVTNTVPVEIAVGQATANLKDVHTMIIKQTVKVDKATIDWQSFDIDKGYAVHFDQTANQIALNNIHQADASKILGSLTSNGQVYLINQNGFLFGKDSHVNLNTLVASTLGISDADFKTGITKVFDQSKTAALQANGALYLKDAQGNDVTDQNGQKVKIEIFVDKDASIKTNAPGGRVILAAPSITNKGSIETPDGQALLAASPDKVYLQEVKGDPNIRGLLVEVGTGGEVNNVGKVLAERGNASLLGFAVNQQGIVSASTSVKLNGSVRLSAHEGIQDPANTDGKLLGASTTRSIESSDGKTSKAEATVTLANGSVTSVELDVDKTAKAIDAQEQLRSDVLISGHKVELQGQSLVKALSGNVTIQGVDNLSNPVEKGDARVYMAPDSKVDVSGVKNVPLSVDRNIVNVELRKNELRDAPLQRNGVLYTQKVDVDIRDAEFSYDDKGKLISASVPTADITGGVARIARNIDERSTTGGTVNLNSSGDVITQLTSQIDFSGGSIAYQGGMIGTTHLVSSGRLFDISQADPNRHYDQILNSAKLLHYSPGYIEGKAGGTLNIAGYEAVLDGDLKGQTVNGELQRLPNQLTSGSNLSIDLTNGNGLGQQDVILSSNTQAQLIDVNLPLPRKAIGTSESIPLIIDTASLSATKSGVGVITLKTNGTLTLNKDSEIKLPELGSLKMNAQSFDLQGHVISPSGTVNIESSTLQGNAIVLDGSAKIDVSGLWINDSQDILINKSLSPEVINGGTINLLAEQGDLVISKGSQINANGGAWQRTLGNVEAGDAGSITLVANHAVGGKATSLRLNGDLSAYALHSSNDVLSGNRASAKGGSLTLKTNEVVIGSSRDVPDRQDSSVVPLVLSPSFFQQGGFSSYDIVSNVNGIKVAANVHIDLQQKIYTPNQRLESAPSGSYLKDKLQATTYVEAFSPKLAEVLSNPVNLGLSFSEINDQKRQESVDIERGATITTGIGGSITLNSDTSINVYGKINAPAGSINLNINLPNVDGGYFSDQGIWLGDSSQLIAKGAFKPTIDVNGLNKGDVLTGGTVNLNARRGYIVTTTNSEIDVSGIKHSLDFMGENFEVSKRDVASDGGSISFIAAEGVGAAGKFIAQAGSKDTAAGGDLLISLDRRSRNKPFPVVSSGQFPDDIETLETEAIIISSDDKDNEANNIDLPENLRIDGVSDKFLSGKALLKSELINQAGFGTINLKVDATPVSGELNNAIVFNGHNGNVDLHAQNQIVLDAPIIKVSSLLVGSLKNQDGAEILSSDGSSIKHIVDNNTDNFDKKVNITSAYVALGSTEVRKNSGLSQLAPDAVKGPNVLDKPNVFNVNTQGLDLVGGLSFNSFDQINLNSSGDLRFRGIADEANGAKDFLGLLNIASELNIKSSQAYPSTLTDYTIKNSLADSTINFLSSKGIKTAIYSAAGKLTVNSPNINQSGDLEAPLGQLLLNADNNLTLTKGSVTSVSGNGVKVLLGQGSGGTNWLYPLNSIGSNNIVFNTPPEKRLELNATDLDLAAGSTINLSGGGDLYAYEFITGVGGSNDVLKTSVSNKFAVIPGLNNSFTPYDPLETPASGLSFGQSVYLNAGAGLTAGWYTMLPAHYALLPNAYLITPKSGTEDQFQNLTTIAGVTVVPGHYGVAGTSIINNRDQGFLVQPGSIARSFSQYADYSANQFFANSTTHSQAIQLPKDAGSLVLAAKNSLLLETRLLANPDNKGLGGQVDVSADSLEIVAHKADLAMLAEGVVGLWADDVNNLKAPSLLLGGKRSKNASGQYVTETAETVVVDSGVNLKGQDLLLTAIDTLSVESGANIESSGKLNQVGGTITVNNKNGNSDGALLRVSNLGQVDLVRDNSNTVNQGILNIASGARLKADGSMLLDSTKNTVSNGTIEMQGGSLALNSSVIGLGTAPSETEGLVLANTQFNLDELLLNSNSALNIYGSVSLNTKNLLISAANINGFNNIDGTVGKANITADSITFNNKGAISTQVGTGTGDLKLTANKEIVLGSGQYNISGFKQVNMIASQSIKGLGQTLDSISGNSSIVSPGELNVAADLTLTSGYFGGDNGATTSIHATGHKLNLAALLVDTKYKPNGLGVKWSLIADSINSNAKFDLPSGILNLTALEQDLNINSGSSIDLSGRIIAFSGVNKSSPAGTFSLVANNGNINFKKDASIKLMGVNKDLSTGNAEQLSNDGSLYVSATKGQFNWQGIIDAKAASGSSERFSKANLTVDVDNFGSDGFSGLNTNLSNAGFAGNVTLEQHSNDPDKQNVLISGNDHVKAQNFELNVDQGSVIIEGGIDVSGLKAGKIAIYGRNGISLGANAELLAKSSFEGKSGGSVFLDTVHRDELGSGQLDLSKGGLIAVSAGLNGTGGSVHLRTGRDDALKAVAVSDINAKIRGADSLKTVLEATRIYGSQATIETNFINTLSQDTSSFMNARYNLVNDSGAPVTVLPGVEVRNDGDLELSNAWDLITWRYSDSNGKNTLPGFLTLRAAGDLKVKASLTDGVANTPVVDQGIYYQDMIQAGQSWSYRLVAGKNINIESTYSALNPLSPDTSVDTQVTLRTGTGDINLVAGKDIILNKSSAFNLNSSNNASAIYTVGTIAYGSLEQLNILVDPSGALVAEYPDHGGNVELVAGGNIQGAQTGQQITDWQVRIGNASTPTSWGINMSSADVSIRPTFTSDISIYAKGNRNFNQNIGALGGGEVRILAGGDINNLSVMIPTNGRTSELLSPPAITAGGDMLVSAGNNIVGGEFYTGLGKAQLVSGGSFSQSPIDNSTEKVGAILYVGDAVFNLQARQDINLTAVNNPSLIKQSFKTLAKFKTPDARFFTYGINSAVNLQAIAGNMAFLNNYQALQTLQNISSTSGSGFEYTVYPGILNAAALSGDIRVDNSMTLFPSIKGQMQLLANRNIGIDAAAVNNQRIAINMSDTDPLFLPTAQTPVANLEGSYQSNSILTRELLDPSSAIPKTIHALVSLHLGDVNRPLIEAKLGNISFPSLVQASVYLPQASDIMAGSNINNLSISGQNLVASDVTVIKAGGDFVYDAELDSNGNVKSNDQQVLLAGPGQLQVIAGHDVNLGSSKGIQSIGNLFNPVLDKTLGADINILAGILYKDSDALALQAFRDKYKTILAYREQLSALEGLNSNQLAQHLDVFLSVLFEEIKQSASAAARAPENQRALLYKQGTDAINTLFAAKEYSGDLGLVFSQIKTLAGGEINLMVPGGKVDVGLAGKLAGISKGPEQLGIVINQQGSLNILANYDVGVNQSRVFTLGGGDITAWSSNGSIDAGKGAKSALSAPAPETTVDENGNIKTVFPPIISGSGIQAIGGGDVTLAAPKGVVDAGEAGISGGHVTIAATAVIGASNISSSGGTVGVPTTVSAPVSLAGANSAAASATKNATQSADDDNKSNNGSDGSSKKKVSIISADIVGFGDCSVADVKEGKNGCGA